MHLDIDKLNSILKNYNKKWYFEIVQSERKIERIDVQAYILNVQTDDTTNVLKVGDIVFHHEYGRKFDLVANEDISEDRFGDIYIEQDFCTMALSYNTLNCEEADIIGYLLHELRCYYSELRND